jgi:PKD repeat protein
VSEPFTFYTPLVNNLLPNLILSASATAAVVGLAPGGGGTAPAQCTQTPTASFTVSASGMTASVDASASAPTTGNCAIATYEWNFGVVSDCSVTGAPGCDLVGVTQSYTYTSPSTYVITLTVQNPNGTATATQSVTVPAAAGCLPPAAVLTVNPTSGSTMNHGGQQGTTFTFDGTGTSNMTGSSCTPVSWTINFGDNTSTSGTTTPITATHKYADTQSGKTLYATLVAANKAGTNTSAQISVTLK